MSTVSNLSLRVASRRSPSRDGELMIVSPSASRWAPAKPIAKTLQELLDGWHSLAPALAERTREIESAGWTDYEPFDAALCCAPLPRAYQWVDASVYRNHADLIYRWRNEPIPKTYALEPLVYQGGSDLLLGPHEDIVCVDEAHQIDLEAEIAVITTDVPMGTPAHEAGNFIAFVVLLNDVSLRGLIPSELTKGFGFYQSKPATSFAPIAVTPTALRELWRDFMPNLRVRVQINGEAFGDLRSESGTVFNFPQIIAHLARTRALAAGTIVGAGTISNEDPATGSACIAEARVRQQLAGVPDRELKRYLRDGDRVRIEAVDPAGRSVFGYIDQKVRLLASETSLH